MEPYTGAQCAFAVKVFYKNRDSFVIIECEFQREFRIHRNRAVPSANAIKTWVWNFEATGSTLKKKGGSVKTVRTPENIAVVNEAIEKVHAVLWGYLKSQVYKAPGPHTVQELKHSIQHEVTQIPVEKLQIVMGDVSKRLTECLEWNGDHLNDVIFGK